MILRFRKSMCVWIVLFAWLHSSSWASQPPDQVPTLEAEPIPPIVSVVKLPKDLYFIDAGGEPLLVKAGDYEVEARDEWLRLAPIQGEQFDSILIEAQRFLLEEPEEFLEAKLGDPSSEYPDLYPLVAYASDELAYEAVGSESGVWPRWGWSSIKSAAKKVGRGAKRVGGAIKSGARRAGRGAVSAGRRIGRGAKSAGRKVGGGIKKGYQVVRDQFCPPDRGSKKITIHTDPKKYREPSSFYLKLAYNWAPIHYQDTTKSYSGKADYVTNADYDKDWVATNNWDNLHRAPLRAYVYYSVHETKTHWFILYMFFHPRDYAKCVPTGKANVWGEHENDLEGAMFLVRKTKDTYGKLEGAVTAYHHDFYSYTPSGSPLKNGKEDIDGKLHTILHRGTARAKTAQEAQGHGLKAWPQLAVRGKNFKGGDGVIYYPSTVSRQKAEIPSNRNDRHVEYALIDFHGKNGIWQHRKNPKTFTKDTGPYSTKFRGDKSGTCGGAKVDSKYCQTDAANAPWGWDDVGDITGTKPDSLPSGMLATDPARLFENYFAGLGDFSREYVHNPYEPW